MTAPPIVILSYNRPHYLRQVLLSLLHQHGHAMADRDVYLFQDGPPEGGTLEERQAVREKIELCIDAFIYMTPANATVHDATYNLGIARNFDRAERFVFDDIGAEAAIFLEDDMVLGPYYLQAMDQMLDFARGDNRIGYVAAYGNHRLPVAKQREKAAELGIMGQNWAFGLTRRQWLAQLPWVDQYMNLVRDVPYSGRDHQAIARLFRSWGLGVPGTSQDIAKSHACILSGAAKVNTVACFARYIGAEGHHFRQSAFERQGYHLTEEFPDAPPVFNRPTPEQIDGWIAQARKSAMVDVFAERPPQPWTLMKEETP